MTDSFITRLESMYSNNEVRGYLAVRIIGEQLSPGWLETGIVSKGLSGSLGSKPNQVDFVIPLSSTIKAVIDRGLAAPGEFGIFLYGESGLMEEKFVVLFSINEPSEGEISREFVAFRIIGYSPHDIIRLVLKYAFGHELQGELDEPDVDYVEYLSDLTGNSSSPCGFSIRMPSNWANPRGWIPDTLKKIENENILFKKGTIQDGIILSLLLSNWVIDMVENLLIKDPLAVSFFQRGNSIESFIWDGPRNLMTTIIQEDVSLEILATNVMIPLWAKSEEVSIPPSKTKEVIVHDEISKELDEKQTERKLSKDEERILSKVEWLLRDVDVNDTFRRIERAEAILSELERESREQEEAPPLEMDSVLESRIKDAIERLESLNERMSSLEERIKKICDNLG